MAENKKLKCLNLGCGNRHFEDEMVDWVNMDNNNECKPHIVRNILRGIPFNDGTFDGIMCSHFLEHFNGDDFIFLMHEIHRVLKDYGELVVISPYYRHFGAYMDVYHKMFFSEHAFDPWFFPSNSSYSMGIRHFFHPIIIDFESGCELKIVMRKVPDGAMSDYVEKIGVPNEKDLKHADGKIMRVEPNWLEIVGRKFETNNN